MPKSTGIAENDGDLSAADRAGGEAPFSAQLCRVSVAGVGASRGGRRGGHKREAAAEQPDRVDDDQGTLATLSLYSRQIASPQAEAAKQQSGDVA